MKENYCNYSTEWQPYKGDYDKYEYDVMLKDGTIATNCYPNADRFHSISKKHDGKKFLGSDVAQIRFTPEDEQMFGINPDTIYASQPIEPPAER